MPTDKRHFRKVARVDPEGITPTLKRKQPKGKTQTRENLVAVFLPYPNGRLSRQTARRQFWTVAVPGTQVHLESHRPEFDVAIELENLGYDPDTPLSFQRKGQTTLQGTVGKFAKGYHAERDEGFRYITRSQVQDLEKRRPGLSQQTTEPP